MKYTLFLLIIATFSCATIRDAERIKLEPRGILSINEERHGFRYDVPPSMVESDEAYRFQYDNLIIDREMNYYDSSVIIMIRHFDMQEGDSLDNFARRDQTSLKESVSHVYDGSWAPQGMTDKGIPFISYQFYYYMGKTKIYQRSVYVQCDRRIHIVSMSSYDKKQLLKYESEEYWNTIKID